MVEQTKPAPAGDEHAEAASVAIQAALEVINRAWLPAKPPLLVRSTTEKRLSLCRKVSSK